jgi:C-terminal binding-module, SLH-like, of glucodextranase
VGALYTSSVFAPILAAALLPATLLLSVPDPAGDASGDGSYQFASQPALSTSMLDLRLLRAEDQGGKLRLKISLGAVGNPWNSPVGFSGLVLDVFVKTQVGGVGELTGLGLRTPGNDGWQEHYRLDGFTVQHFSVGSTGKFRVAAAPRVRLEGTDFVIDTGLRAGQYSYWVTSSAYTPLSPDGLLRPGGDTAAGLLSAREGTPVPLDVLLGGDQKAVYATAELPAVGIVRDARAQHLLWASVGGLLVAVIAGIVAWRRRT